MKEFDGLNGCTEEIVYNEPVPAHFSKCGLLIQHNFTPKFHWACRRPKNHTGPHECSLHGSYSRAYWYTDSDEL